MRFWDEVLFILSHLSCYFTAFKYFAQRKRGSLAYFCSVVLGPATATQHLESCSHVCDFFLFSNSSFHLAFLANPRLMSWVSHWWCRINIVDKRVSSLLNEYLEGRLQPFSCRIANDLAVCAIQHGAVAESSLLTSNDSPCMQCGVHAGLYSPLPDLLMFSLLAIISLVPLDWVIQVLRQISCLWLYKRFIILGLPK